MMYLYIGIGSAVIPERGGRTCCCCRCLFDVVFVVIDISIVVVDIADDVVKHRYW